jgi:hypothetical protein
MGADAQVATVERGELDAAALAAYARAFDERRDTTGGLGDMEACLRGAMLFDVKVQGRVVARYALRQVQRDKGVEVFIVAAAGGMQGVDMVQAVEPHIARQCEQADRLTINTRRRGLVKKLTKQGWTLDSYVMRKKLK